MSEEPDISLGSAVEGIGKGVEHALNGVGALAERINGLTDGCFLPRKANKQIEAAKVRAEGAISILESVGITPTEDDRRASAFFAMREIKGFENIKETIALADIPGTSNVSDIEDEWLSEFLDAASKAFSNWKRKILADVVSEKSLDPKCMSTDALLSIARMEEHHLNSFERVCALRPTINGEKAEPLILAMDDDLLEIVELSVKDLKSLQSIGLLRETPARNRKMAVFDERFIEHFGVGKCQLCAPTEGYPFGACILVFGDAEVESPLISVEYGGFDSFVDKSWRKSFVDYGIVELTEPGRELASLVRPPAPNRIAEYVADGMKTVQKEEADKHPRIAFAERKYGEAIMRLIDGQLKRSRRF